MRIIWFFLATALASTPTLICAQPLPPEGSIIACEGPDMPSQCPRPATQRTENGDRQTLAAKQNAAALQTQQLMWRRQALVRGVSSAVSFPTPTPPLTIDPYLPPNPLLSPPNFKAAAQVLQNAVGGEASVQPPK